jgi:hypothetical protein
MRAAMIATPRASLVIASGNRMRPAVFLVLLLISAICIHFGNTNFASSPIKTGPVTTYHQIPLTARISSFTARYRQSKIVRAGIQFNQRRCNGLANHFSIDLIKLKPLADAE